MNKLTLATVAALVAGSTAIVGQPASAQPAGVNAGVLSCQVASGWGFVFGSSRNLRCEFAKSGYVEHYYGTIAKYGIDIGYLQGGVMAWNVIAPSADMSPGDLAGNFVGPTASATPGLGAAAHVLVGGSDRSVMLQPVSFEGNAGLNVAAGIASLALRSERQVPSEGR